MNETDSSIWKTSTLQQNRTMSSKKASSTQNNTLTTTFANINHHNNNTNLSNVVISGASASASVTAGSDSGGMVNSPRNKYFQTRHQPQTSRKIFNMPKRRLINLDTWTGSVSSITNDNAAFAQMYSDRWGIYNNQTYNIGYNDGNFTNVPTFNFDPLSSNVNNNHFGQDNGVGRSGFSASPRSPDNMQMDTATGGTTTMNPLNLSPRHFHHAGQQQQQQQITNSLSPQHSGVPATTSNNTQQSIDLNSFSMNHSPASSPFQQNPNSPIHQQHFQQQSQHHSQHNQQHLQQSQQHTQQQQSTFQQQIQQQQQQQQHIQQQQHMQQQQQMNSMDTTDIGILPLDVVDYVMELEDEKLSPNPRQQQQQQPHPQQQNVSETNTKQQTQNIHNFHNTNQEDTTTLRYTNTNNNNNSHNNTQNNTYTNMESPFQNRGGNSSSNNIEHATATKIEPPDNSTSLKDSNAELEFYRNFYNNNCNKIQQQQQQQQPQQQQHQQNTFTSALLCDNSQEDEAMMDDIGDINDFNIPSIRPTDGWAFNILHSNGGAVMGGGSEKCNSELVQATRPIEAGNVNASLMDSTVDHASSIRGEDDMKNIRIMVDTSVSHQSSITTKMKMETVEVEEIPKEIFDNNGDT